MPIIFAPINTDLKILKVLVDEKTKRHLESLGIFQNAVIRVVAINGGNVICDCLGVRIALNKEIATKILVA